MAKLFIFLIFFFSLILHSILCGVKSKQSGQVLHRQCTEILNSEASAFNYLEAACGEKAKKAETKSAVPKCGEGACGEEDKKTKAKTKTKASKKKGPKLLKLKLPKQKVEKANVEKERKRPRLNR